MDKHFYVLQNKHEINVPNTIIKKLYDLVIKHQQYADHNITVFDNSSNFDGEITLDLPTYRIWVEKIREMFPRLFINCDYYILFQDNNVESIMLSYILSKGVGDGQGITEDDAKSVLVTQLPSFQNNTTIEYFNELQYFEKISSLQMNVFNGCTNLKEINLVNIRTVNEWTFNGCTSLISANMPNVTSIGSNAFWGCTNLESISCPNIVSVSVGSFRNCNLLQTIDFGEQKIKSIPGVLFLSCSALEYVPDMSEAVGSVDNSAFEGCSQLKHVNLSNKITIIGDDAFYNCGNLEDIGDVSNVTTCVDRAFADCKKLKSLNFTNKLTRIDTAFYGCESITSFGDLSGLTGTLNGAAFFRCKSMKYYKGFENSTITRINGGTGAFEENTSLESITLPSTVTYIGKDTFYACPSLHSVYITSVEPPSLERGDWSFRANNATLYVPHASLEAYQAAESWAPFLNRLQPYDVAPSNDPPINNGE